MISRNEKLIDAIEKKLSKAITIKKDKVPTYFRKQCISRDGDLYDFNVNLEKGYIGGGQEMYIWPNRLELIDKKLHLCEYEISMENELIGCTPAKRATKLPSIQLECVNSIFDDVIYPKFADIVTVDPNTIIDYSLRAWDGL